MCSVTKKKEKKTPIHNSHLGVNVLCDKKKREKEREREKTRERERAREREGAAIHRMSPLEHRGIEESVCGFGGDFFGSGVRDFFLCFFLLSSSLAAFSSCAFNL